MSTSGESMGSGFMTSWLACRLLDPICCCALTCSISRWERAPAPIEDLLAFCMILRSDLISLCALSIKLLMFARRVGLSRVANLSWIWFSSTVSHGHSPANLQTFFDNWRAKLSYCIICCPWYFCNNKCINKLYTSVFTYNSNQN